MNELPSDFEWLQQFARAGNQGAFRELVLRHIDLVFATALRKTEDAGGAEEIAQNVFSALARKAWQFAPDDSVPAWLYKTTLFESQTWLRGELRRRRREQTAMELGTTMKTPSEQTAFNALLPLLDEALGSLREKDRVLLLLRFYEKQSLRNVGETLGLSEDAAQKRVALALDKLSQFFQRQGYRTATVAATKAALQFTAASAPAATAALVVSVALKGAPSGLTGLTALLGRFATLTKTQVAAVCMVAALAPTAWQWEKMNKTAHEMALLNSTMAEIQTEKTQMEEQLRQLQRQSAQLEQRQSQAVAEQSRLEVARQKLAKLQVRTRSLLAADNYRWPDGSPFVRVPKSALAAITVGGGPNSPEHLAVKVDQFLDLNPTERAMASQIFSNYFAVVNNLVENSLIETTAASAVTLPAGAEATVFVLPALGGEIRTALTNLCLGLENTLGPDRWAQVRPDSEFTYYEQVRLLGYDSFDWDRQQEYAVYISHPPEGGSMIGWKLSNGESYGQIPFSVFQREPSMFVSQLPQCGGPPALMERMKQYFLALAQTGLSNTATK